MGSDGCPCKSERCTHRRTKRGGTKIPSIQTHKNMQGFGIKKTTKGKKKRG